MIEFHPRPLSLPQRWVVGVGLKVPTLILGWLPSQPAPTLRAFHKSPKFSGHKMRQAGKQELPLGGKRSITSGSPKTKFTRVTIERINPYKCFSPANVNLGRKSQSEVLSCSLNWAFPDGDLGELTLLRILILRQLLSDFRDPICSRWGKWCVPEGPI